MKKTILCYGDSNTWGYVPQAFNNTFKLKRYSENERWPKVLQEMLGNQFYVIEEGLNGRTTNLEYNIPPNRNGKNYLASCLYSHAPIDLVIIALGGNDMKNCYQRSTRQIFDALMELVTLVQESLYGTNFNSAPDVLLISPVLPLPIGEKMKDETGNFIFHRAKEKVIELEKLLSSATHYNYLNIINSVKPSDIDGLHLDEKGHYLLAEIVYKKLLKIFGKNNG